MESLTSLKDYYDLIKKTKERCKISFSNMYYMADTIQRYIDLGRMYFVETEGGVLFFMDEEKYYMLCLSVNAGDSLDIPEMKKKILVRNVYRKNQKSKMMEQVEEGLVRSGFHRGGTSIQIQGRPSVILEKKKGIERCIGIIERNGYRIVQAEASMLEEIENLVTHAPFLYDYQIDFKTNEEKQENLKQGGYLCVVDQNNEVCAATITWVHGKSADGSAIVVGEKYKMMGLAPAICYERLKRLQEQGIESLQGWVLLNNEASMRYHKSMGFEFMNKYVDNWIREGNR